MSLHTLFSDLAHSTIQNWDVSPTEQISQHCALFRWMKEHGNIKNKPGGIEIVHPVIIAENNTIQNYAGYQVLNTGYGEVTQLTRYPWAQKAMHVTSSGAELRINQSKEAMYNLLDTKLKAAKITAANRMSIEIYGDGSIANSIQGLQNFVPQNGAGVVGGLDSAIFPAWKSKFETFATGSLTTANVRSYFNKLYLKTTVGMQSPDLIVCSNDIYALLEGAAQLQIQYPYPYMDKKQANFGFASIPYKKAQVIHDENVNFAENSERAYFLDSSTFYLFQHPDAKWDQERGRTPVNQDVTVIPFYWMGGMACDTRRRNGVLKGV